MKPSILIINKYLTENLQNKFKNLLNIIPHYTTLPIILAFLSFLSLIFPLFTHIKHSHNHIINILIVLVISCIYLTANTFNRCFLLKIDMLLNRIWEIHKNFTLVSLTEKAGNIFVNSSAYA